MPSSRSPIAPEKPRVDTLNADGRSSWAKRFRSQFQLYLSDIGGEEAASEAEKALLHRAAAMTIELQNMEVQFSRSTVRNYEALEVYSRIAGNLKRMLETTGIRRRPRDVTPTIEQYLDDS